MVSLRAFGRRLAARTIRRTLLLVAAAGIVPLLGVGAFSAVLQLERQEVSELRSNMEASRAGAAGFEAICRDIERHLTLVAGALVGMPRERVVALLDQAVRDHGAMLEMLWIEPDGRVGARGGPAHLSIGQPATQWLQQLRSGTDVLITDLFQAGPDRTPVFVVARSIPEAGAGGGAIVAVVDPTWIDVLLPSFERMGTGRLAILDRAGRTVFEDPPAYHTWSVRRPEPTPFVRQALGGHEASGRYRSPIDGLEYFGAATPISNTGWVAVASRCVEEILAPARRDALLGAALSAGVAGMAVSAAVIFSSGLRKRLAQVQTRSAALVSGERLGMGRLGFREVDALADALDALADRVRMRESQLQTARGWAEQAAYAARRDADRLVELGREREDLLRMMSHDVRIPLNAVLMQAELLRRGARDDEVRRRATSIAVSVRRVTAMIQDLLDMSLAQEGRLRLALERIELEPFAREVLDRLQGVLAVERVRLSAHSPPAVLADPNRLERVLVNLLSNALKYSPPDREVRLDLGGSEAGATVAVTDEGPGIAPDELPRISERYYRGERTSGKEGLGLGLFISRLLVEAHGGTLRVDSERGKGSTFRVMLPVTLPARPGTGAPAGFLAHPG
jgi:signal transduction histidine kinase